MDFDIFEKNRSYRSFTDKELTKVHLLKMIENARVSASSMNRQILRYALVDSKELCDKIFPLTGWAGYIDWSPTKEEAPHAYIALCLPNDRPVKENFAYFDMGLVSQNILLTAVSMGYGGCILANFRKKMVHDLLNIPDNYDCKILIALGEPAEVSTIVDAVDGEIKYYRDVEKRHHYVPKIPLNELIF